LARRSGRIRDPIHSDIDHKRARTNHVSSDKVGTSGRDYQNFRTQRVLTQITSMSMADRYSAVCVFGILHHESRHRLSDDVASSDDDAFLARRCHTRRAQQLADPRRSARNESVTLSDQHLADVNRMKTVDIL